MRTSDFDFELPVELIAQFPASRRSGSRLLCLDGNSGALQDRMFSELPSLLSAGDLLVFNDTRVIKARLNGLKESGGKVEVLVERMLDAHRALAHVRASHAPKPGSRLILAEAVEVEVLSRQDDLFELKFLDETPLAELLERYGKLPLPPYITKVIPAYFHSSSGGYTENSENVWGTYKSYLRGAVDYDQNSPQYKWERKLTTNELKMAISKAGYTIGTIKAIELAPLTYKPMSTPERGVSGRVKIIRFIGSAGSAQLTGEQLRKILDLKSTLFDVSVMVPAEKVVDDEQGFIADRKKMHHISGRPNEIIVISGFGWGHGLGLSQWGAKAMAEQGPQGDSTYFKEILKHYYQGTTIKKVF